MAQSVWFWYHLAKLIATMLVFHLYGSKLHVMKFWLEEGGLYDTGGLYDRCHIEGSIWSLNLWWLAAFLLSRDLSLAL